MPGTSAKCFLRLSSPLPLFRPPPLLFYSMSPFLLLLFIACRAGAVGSREVGRVSRAHLGTCFFAPAAACAVIPQVNLKCDQSRTLRAIGNGDLILQSFACLSQSVRLRGIVWLSGCLYRCSTNRQRKQPVYQYHCLSVCLIAFLCIVCLIACLPGRLGCPCPRLDCG